MNLSLTVLFQKPLFLIWLLNALLLWGCSKNEATAREEGSPTPAASGDGLEFTAPPDWIMETPSTRMRRAQYRLPQVAGDPEDAEMAVFFFPGQGGSVQANVDRWIGQFSKPDGSPASEVAKITHKQSHGIPLTVLDVSGTYRGSGGPMMAASKPKADFRMLAAVAETSSGPWFFKLTGPARTVAKWEASFHSFLETLQ